MMKTICSICTRECEKRMEEKSVFTAFLVGTKYDDKKEMCVTGCYLDDIGDFCEGCAHYNVNENTCIKNKPVSLPSSNIKVYQMISKEQANAIMEFAPGYYKDGYLTALGMVKEWLEKGDI